MKLVDAELRSTMYLSVTVRPKVRVNWILRDQRRQDSDVISLDERFRHKYADPFLGGTSIPMYQNQRFEVGRQWDAMKYHLDQIKA